jgi:predicted chitinase
MDPEIQREFEEQLRQMSDMLSQINSTMAGTVKNIQSQTSAISGNTASVKQQTDANNQLSTSVTGRTKAEEAASIANEKFSKTTESLASGFKAVGSSLTSFGSAIRDASAGYSKYSGGLTQLTKGVGDLVGNFGFLGKALGFAITAVGSIAAPILEYNDALLKGFDDLSKFGAGAGLSAEQIMKLGHDANFSSKTLGILTNNAKEMNRSLIAMNGSFTAGFESFSKFIGLTDDQLKKYRNLGFSQEELAESMTKYAAMQAKAGNSMVQTPQQLQKASLAYIDNLLTLAELTGIDVAKQQEARDQALADENFNAYIFQKQLERDRATDEAEKAKIQAVIDAKLEYAATAKATLDATTAAARIQAISTDGQVNFTESNSVLLLQNADIQKQQDELMKGNSQAVALQKDNYDIQARMSDSYGDIAAGLGGAGKAIQQTMGMTNEARESANLFKKHQAELAGLSGKALEDKMKEIKDDAAARVEATKGKDTGATADDATKEALERQLNIMTDQFLDPLAAGARKLINEGLEKAVDAFTILNDFLNDDFMTTLRKLKEFFDGLPTTIKILSAALLGLAGASVLGKVVGAFRVLGLAAGGLGSVFSKLKNAFSGAIGWLKNLLPGGKSKPSPGPKKGADGRYRDAKGRFAAAPKASDVAKGGKALKLAKGLFGGLGSLVGGLALDYGSEKAAEAGHTKTAAGLSVGSSAATGAGMGAMLGSVVPGVGTVVGGAVGGLLGGAYGLYQNWDGLTGGPEQEKAKVEKETAEKNKTSADKSSTSSAKAQKSAEITEKSVNLNKKTTDHFGKMVTAFGKIVAANGKIVVAFAGLIKLFGESVKTFETTIKELVDNLSTMTGVSSDAGGGAASGENIPQNVQGNLEAIAQGMRKKGFGDENYINAVLGNVMKESGGRFDRQEDLAGYKNTSNARIRNIFGSRASGKTDAELDAIKSDPKMMGEMMYGSSTKIGRQMGNKEPGDGWKYRGRGPIQLTGKSNYAKASKDIYGDDRLVKDPDLVLQPDVGVEVVAWFMQQNEKSMRKQLGFSPDQALSKQEAALLATSQIAGQKITRGSGYLGTENLQKAESFAAAMPTGVGAGGRFSSGAQGGAANAASKELISTKPSNVKVGDKADLSGMDSNLLSRFFTAAKEFGQDININSAYRGDDYQAQLWVRGRILGEPGIHTPARPKNDTTITYKGKQYTVEGSGTGSKHGRGEALDISTHREAFDPVLAKYGLHRPFKQKDPPHVELKARKGGVFTGPDSGYPIELHGQEIVAPLTADSVLMKLAKTPAISTEGGRLEASATSLGGGSTAGTGNVEAIVKMHSELISVLTSKLDNMIDVLDDGNDTREKIFKHSMV